VLFEIPFYLTCFVSKNNVFSRNSVFRLTPRCFLEIDGFVQLRVIFLRRFSQKLCFFYHSAILVIKMRCIVPKSGMFFFFGPVPYFNEKILVAANLFRISPTAVDEQ